MLIKNTLKLMLLAASCGFLVACSTASDSVSSLDGERIAANKVVASGVAEDNEFLSSEEGRKPGLSVGNQICYFDFDSSVLKSSALTALEVQARYLIDHPTVKVLIAGNTDERGSREYNIGLGQRRALSVTRFLRAKGVSKQQMLTVSFGAEKPVAFGHSEVDYAKNRRAELQYQAASITDKVVS